MSIAYYPSAAPRTSGIGHTPITSSSQSQNQQQNQQQQQKEFDIDASVPAVLFAEFLAGKQLNINKYRGKEKRGEEKRRRQDKTRQDKTRQSTQGIINK